MRAALLSAARAYARAARIPLRTVSRRVYGDSRFFASVKRGATFSAAKYDDVMAFFADPANWRGRVVPAAVVDLFASKELPK